MTKHIAMWSGPRNISTAMMRSFENRPDTFVSDEPFYGYYLNNTDIDHPGKKEVLRSMEYDWDKVVDYITGIIPEGASLWYQKHMAQHNLPGVDLSWISQVTNCFLIRDPKEVILSYSKKYEVARSELLGFSQQVELYRKITEEIGEDPIIIEARDVLHDPKDILQKFCEAVGISFMDEMLS
ncbi:MAG: sulfotransferase family protein, partial [Candidatus Marinimicrobia bacterium]|nr:sulfotransferase family protein [Candidatus Neomarinimicrobiota bacterium]